MQKSIAEKSHISSLVFGENTQYGMDVADESPDKH